MILWRVTDKHSRRSIKITRQGFETRYERPSTNGGWYTRELVVVPWRSEDRT